MALPGSSAFFKTPTALEQLLEEINFQRTKEMRQLMKDDSGFVVLQGTSYWTDLFVRHFLFQTEHCIDCDDLLFFVRKKHIKSSSRYLPKFETEVDVFRKASRKLPIGDPDMDWEETVYLNLIIHQFDYTLTLAICTRTSPKELQVLKRHSQKVYASPSRRRMDTKAESEEMTYPNICFMVDNFNEVFCDILVRDGEMVCVELVASDRDGAVQGVIFLGSIRYDALKRVYDARSSLSSKVAQRMTFGLFSNSSSQRVEFVRMKGPQGKGHAEMAVTKPKGYGAETPTSEPGYCATDMWDSDWDSDPEDFFVYRHQRRLSDPSANINNFVRGGWKTKPADSAGAKSRSENEGLDSLANGLSEIEAGDIRDDCEFCKNSASTVCEPSISKHVASAPVNPSSQPSIIASFFPMNKTQANGNNPVKVRPVSPTLPSRSLSESDHDTTPNDISSREDAKKCTDSGSDTVGPVVTSFETPTANTPARTPTGSFTETPTSTPASTLEITVTASISAPNNRVFSEEKQDGGDDEDDDDDDDDDFEDCVSSLSESTPVPSCVSREDSPVHRDVWRDATNTCVHNKMENCESCALEKLVISNNKNSNKPPSNTYHEKENELPETERTDLRGTEPVKASEDCRERKTRCKHGVEGSCILCGDRRPFFAKLREKHEAQVKLLEQETKTNERTNPKCSHCRVPSNPQPESPSRISRRRKTESSVRRDMAPVPETLLPETVPRRVMPDGTSVYYWCDVADRPPDLAQYELDDGAYNPLWTMRGFTQTFHFWKENKRAQSVPLNAFLTYITLPWWSIAKDILDHREKPTLTF